MLASRGHSCDPVVPNSNRLRLRIMRHEWNTDSKLSDRNSQSSILVGMSIWRFSGERREFKCSSVKYSLTSLISILMW